MALRIVDYKMSSNRSPHTARLAPGKQYAWEVSWLPGRHLNRNEAITAMVLADTTANGDVHPGHRAWPHVEGWAAELGMTGSQALDRIAGPPRWASRQEKTAEPPDARPKIVAHPDPDVSGGSRTLTRSTSDGLTTLTGPNPSTPTPAGPASACGQEGTPAYLSDLAVSDWHQERHPDKSATPLGRPPRRRDPQPAPEPDKLPDWEAGQ